MGIFETFKTYQGDFEKKAAEEWEKSPFEKPNMFFVFQSAGYRIMNLQGNRFQMKGLLGEPISKGDIEHFVLQDEFKQRLNSHC